LSFADLGLVEPLLRALRAKSYASPTPIQRQAIPALLQGRDLLGIAQTGTGKTAAFALPILQALSAGRDRARPRAPRALVLTPTRELAAQIGQSFADYGHFLPLRHAVIFGGVGQMPQVQALRRGVDVLVATPGRLLDLLQQRHVILDDVGIFVLDEADRMLDMGFIHDVRKIIRLVPEDRQSLLFSATMPPSIVTLAHSILQQPLRVEVTPPATTVERVEQSVYLVEKTDKSGLLWQLLQDPAIDRALVFTRTKHGADRVVKHLRKLGEPAEAIHGNKSQSAREKALAGFKAGRTRVLVATDIAARGIDVPEISHVINFDLPNVPESYVHRIGRTARAGRDGVSLSFCASDERPYLRAIEQLTRQRIRVLTEHSFHSTVQQTRKPASPVRQWHQPSGRKGAARRPNGPGPRHPGRTRRRHQPA
jgi:ATP-dependent RNA helicase RhlE